MKCEIDQLLELIAKNLPFNSVTYPELNGATDEHRLMSATFTKIKL